MATYLGNSGLISLTRKADGELRGAFNPDDIDSTNRRFSFDFPNGSLLTGDRVNFRRLNPDGSTSDQPLGLTASTATSPDGSFFVNVDELGGIRLYASWSAALTGSTSTALALTVPADSYTMEATIDAVASTCVGQVVDFNISTDREAIDVTSLGEGFQRQASGLVSGSGSLRAIWDWRQSECGTLKDDEVPQYFHQLILRQDFGSEFLGNFFLKRRSIEPTDEALPFTAKETALYYEAECIVTSVGIDFTPSDIIQSQINFAMTGPITLKYALPSAYLILQEDGDKIFLEEGDGYLAGEVWV